MREGLSSYRGISLSLALCLALAALVLLVPRNLRAASKYQIITVSGAGAESRRSRTI
jgi:hypothetical protein